MRFFYPFRVIYRCAIIENLVVSIHCRRILKNLQVIRATNVCANIKNFDIFQPLVGVFWDSLHYLDNLWMCYYSFGLFRNCKVDLEICVVIWAIYECFIRDLLFPVICGDILEVHSITKSCFTIIVAVNDLLICAI